MFDSSDGSDETVRTPIFTHLRFIRAVASDQHNNANNIKIKGVHPLTLRPNALISLIDHFTVFNGCMEGQMGGPTGTSRFLSGKWGPGPTARIQDPHIGPIHTYVRACMYVCMANN